MFATTRNNRRFRATVLLIGIVGSTIAVASPAQAHGNCTVYASVPHKSGDDILSSGRYSCDYQHDTLNVEVCYQKYVSGTWEWRGCMTMQEHDAKDVYATNVHLGYCTSGTWRNKVKGVAINDNLAIAHTDGYIVGGTVTISC